MADSGNSGNSDSDDPELLSAHSTLKPYATARFEYPLLRVFHRPHPNAPQLPQTPAPLPLLVFVPGLGGSIAQFHPLLTSLVHLAPCLALDWPGCGLSRFSPRAWDAYTSDSLIDLLALVIEDHRDAAAGQTVVLIGHSMGCALAAGLAARKAEYVVGLVAICPVAGPLSEAAAARVRMLFWIPAFLFSLWRAWDGRGGPESESVARFVGRGAGLELRRLQHRFNQQSRTPVWRRMAYGAIPVRYDHGRPVGGLPGLDAWAGLDIPVYLIAGADDNITPPGEVDKILKAMDYKASALPDGGAEAEAEADQESPDSTEEEPPPQLLKPPRAVDSIIFPAPANHALLYSPPTARVLAGLLSDFLAARITPRLSLAWQLQHLSREGKWDVKNLLKWQSVIPVSLPLPAPPRTPIFRVLKTLREVDDVHSPASLVRSWAHEITDLVDLSRDQPVYDPRGLERGGIHYHKMPTLSKVPPAGELVDRFIALVDGIREGHGERAAREGWAEGREGVVAVHCHYGFNRSGYFVVCYLVERCGMELRDAVEEFARAKPNGIRHSHFLDRLHMRYDMGK